MCNQPQGEAGNSVNNRACSSSIVIYPARYAVVPKKKKDEEKATYHKYASQLEMFNGGLLNVPLSQSKYTLRTMRAGFIYMRDKKYTHLWEIDENGMFISLQGGVAIEGYKGAIRGNPTPHIWTKDCEKKIWILFASQPLSKNMLKKLETDSAWRKQHMREIDVEELTNKGKESSKQKHTLPIKLLKEQILEFAEPDLDLSWSSSSTAKPSGDAESLINVLSGMFIAYKPKTPIIVALDDPEGLTQDLGGISKLYKHTGIELTTPPEKRKNNRNKKNGSIKVTLPKIVNIDSAHLTVPSHDYYRKKLVASLIEGIMEQAFPLPSWLKDEDIKKMSPQDRGDSQQYNIETNIAKYKAGKGSLPNNIARLKVVSDPDINDGLDKEFLEHVNMEALTKFKADEEKEKARQKRIKEPIIEAAQDHCNWLNTGDKSYKNMRGSLANKFEEYDRDVKVTSIFLEASIGFCIEGGGIKVPSINFEEDPQLMLLEKFLEDDKSMLHTAISAWTPWNNKADSFADMIQKVDEIKIGEDKLFDWARKYGPSIGTEIVSANMQHVTLRKIDKKWAWKKTKHLRRNVLDAVKDKSSKKFIAALTVRNYVELNRSLKPGKVAAKISFMIGNEISVTDVEKGNVTYKNHNKPRAGGKVDVKQKITSTTKSPTNLLASIPKAGLYSGVAYLHWINLSGAMKSVMENPNHTWADRFNLGSAIAGATQGFAMASAAVFDTGAQTHKLFRQLVTKQAITRAAGRGFIAFLVREGTHKLLGRVGAALELFTGISKALSKRAKGDIDSARWEALTGVALAAAFVVPGIGWAVALLALGIFAAWRASATEDSVYTRWVDHTIFGNKKNKTLKAYRNLGEELQGYYEACYSPGMTKAKDIRWWKQGTERYSKYHSRKAGYTVTTDRSHRAGNIWHENGWNEDTVEFTFLLPAYDPAYSHYDVSLSTWEEDDIEEDNAKKYTPLQSGLHFSKDEIKEKLTNQGLVVSVRKTMKGLSSDLQSAGVKVMYYVNQSFNNQIKVETTLYLDD